MRRKKNCINQKEFDEMKTNIIWEAAKIQQMEKREKLDKIKYVRKRKTLLIKADKIIKKIINKKNKNNLFDP